MWGASGNARLLCTPWLCCSIGCEHTARVLCTVHARTLSGANQHCNIWRVFSLPGVLCFSYRKQKPRTFPTIIPQRETIKLVYHWVVLYLIILFKKLFFEMPNWVSWTIIIQWSLGWDWDSPPVVSEMADIFLIVCIMYFCEVVFSVLILIKSKYQSALKRVKGTHHPIISNIQTRFFDVKINKYVHCISTQFCFCL